MYNNSATIPNNTFINIFPNFHTHDLIYDYDSDDYYTDSDSYSNGNDASDDDDDDGNKKYKSYLDTEFKEVSKQTSIECEHYRNLCRILCPKCPDGENIYACHKCHNEKQDLKNINKHYLESNNIHYVLCIKCNHKQSFGKKCEKCKTVFAQYICIKCKLLNNKGSWNDYYHCDHCKCCYNGNKDYYKHCDNCNICISSTDIATHTCRKNNDWSINTLCTICQDSIRSQMSVIMLCGHVIHRDCFTELIKTTYKCPECSKSITDTAKIFATMKREIDQTPLHEELQKDAKIKCNDCNDKNIVKFHYIGNQCPKCKSFNTYTI
jgi:DNA-directed RNA polymerase subunit RPC12/RpoP